MLRSVTERQRLQQMIDELRRIRERCEPKSNQNPRYLHYSNAVSALLCVPYWASHPYP